MWSWNRLGCLLTVLLFTSARAQDKETTDLEYGPVSINLSINSTDLSGNDTFSVDDSSPDIFSSIADELNYTKIDVHHTGDRIDKESFRPTSPVGLTTLEDPKELKYRVEAGNESEYDDGVTADPENEVLKPDTDEEKTKSTRSPDDVNPSKNVTIHYNYSIVKKYPTEAPGLEEQPNKTECTAPFDDDGKQYNWYQIIIENGGAPGKVNATRLTPNVTRESPCESPISATEPQDSFYKCEGLLYKYELIEYEKVYRREEGYLRYPGTDSEFVDVHGHFVWSPPGYRRRYYRLEYREAEKGFRFKVHRGQKCEFFQNPVSVKCDRPLQACHCEDDGTEICRNWSLRKFSAALTASLTGG